MSQNQEEISIGELITVVSARQRRVECTGLSGASAAYMAARLFAGTGRSLVIIVPDEKAAERMMGDIRFFAEDGLKILNFPSYNVSPFQLLSYNSDIAAKRIDTLYRLLNDGTPTIVVATIGSVLQKIMPKQALIDYAELLIAGEETDRDSLVEKLVAGGYVRSVLVEEPGDFSIRGGILDLYSPLYADPLRVEFFGDMVESIRSFSAVNQRKTGDLQEAIVLPARETILSQGSMTQIIGRVRELASLQGIPVTVTRELVDRIKHEGVFPGAESLLPLIYGNLDSLIDYVPSRGLFLLTDPDDLSTAADTMWGKVAQYHESAAEDARLCPEPESLYLEWSAIGDQLAPRLPVSTRPLSILREDERSEPVPQHYKFAVADNTGIRAKIRHQPEKDLLFSPLMDWLETQRSQGCAISFVCSTRSQAERLMDLLSPYGVALERMDKYSHTRSGEGRAFLCIGQLSAGLVWPTESISIVTEDEIFGSKHHRRMPPRSRIQTQLLAFEDLKQGDSIVHVDHGIGRYDGLVKLNVNGSSNDFLLITYQGDDKLYLPVDRMAMVQKYVGVDGMVPVMDKLGGVTWDRVRQRVKKSAEKIAGDLLKLYAARKVEKGHAFPVEDSYFREFETGFSYEETSDQLRAIDEVLHDMKQSTPMDRLVCGDVGYGKTEVALRAAFLAVNAGKQVALLVPTTVLAEQHFATFSSRFERYPVRIECLSRFRSPSKQRQIVKELGEGSLDIVIGTHRLLQKDIRFGDLGLVVLDEEQRFGVKHKEALKTLRKTVDVLALTATPIPRTLHLSLLGVRDISVISTPPEHRQAILTYISEFDEAIIAEAIERELSRKGQIFFVHNNINTIDSLASRLQALVPRVRLGIAHGRLKEDALEQVMLRFVNRDIDMLVCTTIIESGLDIPAANTMLVNRADRFGLSQMYQLRGRVGRAEEQAFAYLFIPRGAKLSRDAQKRLKVLMEYSDLGAGFQIAMSDLKIRGGGTILGGEQSGHIAAVGYDMFLKLMAESIANLKGEPIEEPLDPEINVVMSALIPESYIADIDQRLMTYRRLVKLTSLEGIADLKSELIDRFGELPPEGGNLLLKMMLRVLAIKAAVKRLDIVGRELLLYFSDVHLQNPLGIVDMVSERSPAYELTADHVFRAKLSPGGLHGRLNQVKNILKEIARHVTS